MAKPCSCSDVRVSAQKFSMRSATAPPSRHSAKSHTFIGSCRATVSGNLFSNEQISVVPERGVPVMSTWRTALTTMTILSAQQCCAPPRNESRRRRRYVLKDNSQSFFTNSGSQIPEKLVKKVIVDETVSATVALLGCFALQGLVSSSKARRGRAPRDSQDGDSRKQKIIRRPLM